MSSARPNHLLIFTYLASCISVTACVELPDDEFGPDEQLSPALVDGVDAPEQTPVPAAIPPTDPDEPSCSKYLRLPAGLSYHLLEAQCSNEICSFDYDPPEQLITKVIGSYSQATGDFSWSMTYVPEHWLVSTSVSGNATFNDDNDETSSFVRTSTDIAGDQTVENVELDREGCELTTDTTRDGVTETVEGEFSDEFDYHAERTPAFWNGPFQLEANGVYIDGLIEEDLSVQPSPDDSPFWWGYQEGLYSGYDGKTYLDFYQWSPVVNRSRSGFCEISVGGAQTCEADIDNQGLEGFAAWWLNYAGNGGGIHEFEYYDEDIQDWEAESCELSFVDGVCSQSCQFSPDTSCSGFLFN